MGKRRSSKPCFRTSLIFPLYFYDTGLACSLLRINNLEALENYYQKGGLFENFMINEICRGYFNRGERPPFYYLNDGKGHEIDLILDLGGRLLPVEIKSGRTFSPDYFKNMDWWRKSVDRPLADSLVVYGDDQDWEMGSGKLVCRRRATEMVLSY